MLIKQKNDENQQCFIFSVDKNENFRNEYLNKEKSTQL